MLQCYNRGCGQKYDPENNTHESCCHHPGEPYFHDAYKGWSCCNKKSVDFTQFLNIRGCTLSMHSNVKPPEPEKPQKDENDIANKNGIVEVRAPIKERMERPSITTPMVAIQATVAPALKETINALKTKAVTTADDELEKGVVPLGTSCKNSGCTYAFTGTSADESECQYHPGVPIFHEGMKYWSCCQKKTTDFAVFMSQKGCIDGQHKWIKENDNKMEVKCRYDWHQTATNVIVAVYAKVYHYARSTIEVNPIRLHVNLVFPDQDNATFDLDLELRGVIDVKKTTAHMYGSKIEITMAKAEPGSWSNLDFPRAKLPPPLKNDDVVEQKPADSDDDFNLDDIETVNAGLRLADITTQNRCDLD